MPRPIPRELPVTSAFFPWRDIFASSLRIASGPTAKVLHPATARHTFFWRSKLAVGPAARCASGAALAFRSNDDARQARPPGAPPRRVGTGWGRGPAQDTARKRQALGPRATRSAARRRQLCRARSVRRPPIDGFRPRGAEILRRRGHYRVRQDRRATRLRLLPGFYGFRRIAVRVFRRENREDHGPGDA